MRPRCLLATATISILVGSAAAQAPAALTLRDAVEAALRNQPSIKSAGLNVDLAEKRAGEARAERLPSVRISETLTHGNNPVFVFGSLLEQSRFGPQNFSLPALNNPAPMTNLRTALSVNLPAFDGMKTAAHVAQADIGKEQAVLQKKLAEQRIRFEAVRSYFDVTVALVAVEVANDYSAPLN
jgi:outer membrane protein TolC